MAAGIGVEAWVRIRSAEGAEMAIKSPKDANTVAKASMVSMARPPDCYIDVGTKNGAYGYAIEDIL
ncbi:hypothetical protein [Cohnella thailandensis]|uniref:Uncharacterized protein n=1 Tax=Cohnella thailandensis TaxID=557557 RepID=A0A841SJW4_9BACL|nr:hypothetical protein [Cohnella thailandensis]MBB6632813.1 hypothetical protein [Cohnella thailandensis]MBP1975495.1 hypothetical protein [Cohnella thailandensis]